LPLKPGEPWDLGHVDPEHRAEFGNRHPEHIKCNRATLTIAKGLAPKARRERPPHDCREEFDPRGCEECRRSDPEPAESVTRWGRHWTGGFNPRCRDCRRLGAPCDAAKRNIERGAA